ncbi:MAG: GntR family transcriptional regulator [Bacteroidetes bacterium]|nr:GntR family transcriptional regulator [Bacteroidota bacterium]
MRSIRSGVSHTIAEMLKQDIITGKRVPGSPLLQAQIAEEFSASHVPVREALQALQADGLASYLPRKGASVSLISADDIQDIIDLRIELEGLALKRAMQAKDDIDINKTKEILEMTNSSNNIDTWVSNNWSYHRNLYRPCKNSRLILTIEELWLHSERYLRAVWEILKYQDKSQAEHEDILLKVNQKDIIGAVNLLKKHIKQAGIGLIKILPKMNIL